MAIVVGIVSELEYERIKAAGYDEADFEDIKQVYCADPELYDEPGFFALAVWVDCDVEDLLDIPGKEKTSD